MEASTPTVPVVMAFSGLDPTGGAGLAADIEAVASMGCHVAPLATALTVQDTRRAVEYRAVDPALLAEQARAVLDDMPVHAFKIGMTGSVQVIEVLHTLVNDYPEVPLVLDPVLAAGGGGELAGEGVVEALRTLLLPQTTVLTPNTGEARALAPEGDGSEAWAQELLGLGCEFVLVTDAGDDPAVVENVLYGNRRRLDAWTWERLPRSYHGSGCTLAAAIAGLLAQGLEPFTAIHEAQEYTWEALKHGYGLGRGQRLPNRLFWARGEG